MSPTRDARIQDRHPAAALRSGAAAAVALAALVATAAGAHTDSRPQTHAASHGTLTT